jgi:hypothetical protein
MLKAIKILMDRSDLNSKAYGHLLAAAKSTEFLKPQSPTLCVTHHQGIMRELVKQTNKGYQDTWNYYAILKFQRPTEKDLIEALAKGPCLLVAKNISQERSKYASSHHATVLVEIVLDTFGKPNVVVIDCDDTIGENGRVYLISLEALVIAIQIATKNIGDGEEFFEYVLQELRAPIGFFETWGLK